MTTEAEPWRDGLKKWLGSLPKEGVVLVATDFDGTVSEIAGRAEDAILLDKAKKALSKLAELRPRVRIAFLSGRGIASLAPRLGELAARSILVGNHGLEIQRGDGGWVHPAAAEARPAFADLVSALKRAVTDFPGAEVEDKGLSLSLHYRRVERDRVPGLLERLKGINVPAELSRHSGKMVMEYRPAVPWNKGKALRQLADQMKCHDAAVAYLGDDVTDEDVFREFGAGAFTVHVGPAGAPTAARWRVDDPAAACEVLWEIAERIG